MSKIPRCSVSLCVDAEQEAGRLVGVEGAGDDDVDPRRHLVVYRHLSQVDERWSVPSEQQRVRAVVLTVRQLSRALAQLRTRYKGVKFAKSLMCMY